jgi:hypothetical protein
MGPKGRPDSKTDWPTDRRSQIQLHFTPNTAKRSHKMRLHICEEGKWGKDGSGLLAVLICTPRSRIRRAPLNKRDCDVTRHFLLFTAVAPRVNAKWL